MSGMEGMKRILRWEVPVDDETHLVPAGIVHVASRRPDVVEVWTAPSSETDMLVRVVGTGQPHPDHWVWRGTALAPNGLVWHLMQVPPYDTPGPALHLSP